MPVTFDEMTMRTSRDSWRAIRSMRHSPPGDARDGHAVLFNSALEQAQQQFVAASAIGYESRPLNLFYGLSQAGRAIAAVSHTSNLNHHSGTDEPWELTGQGIRVQGLEAIVVSNFADMQMRGDAPGTRGSFARLAALLGGAAMNQATNIGQLWSVLLEATWTTPLVASPTTILRVTPDLAAGGADWLATVLTSRRVWDSIEGDEARMAELISRYPSLGSAVLSTTTQPFRWGSLGKDEVSFPIYWLAPTMTRDLMLDYRNWLFTDYRGTELVFPELHKGAGVQHPLLVWWAILYGLSMLARYRPATWTDLININKSPYASAIEHLLDSALDSVPDLVARTIQEVSI